MSDLWISSLLCKIVLLLHMSHCYKSLPITTNVVSLNPLMVRCTRYNIIICDKFCQWFAADWWFSPGSLVSSPNKTDHYDITDIHVWLKVALSTIALTLTHIVTFKWGKSIFTFVFVLQIFWFYCEWNWWKWQSCRVN